MSSATVINYLKGNDRLLNSCFSDYSIALGLEFVIQIYNQIYTEWDFVANGST